MTKPNAIKETLVLFQASNVLSAANNTLESIESDILFFFGLTSLWKKSF